MYEIKMYAFPLLLLCFIVGAIYSFCNGYQNMAYLFTGLSLIGVVIVGFVLWVFSHIRA